MIETLGHDVLSSLKEFIDYRLLKDLHAFTVRTGVLYQYTDLRYPTKNVYGSSYATWTYHGEVAGVSVPSGIGSYPRGSGGLSIDFHNGRAIFNSGYSGLALTGVFTVPDINVYLTTSPYSKIINQTNFQVQPDMRSATSYLPPYSSVLPALFLRLSDTKNERFALGGAEMTEYNISVSALMSDQRYTVGVSDLIRDLKDRIIPIVDTPPLNAYNDLKNTSWNYNYFITGGGDYLMVDESYLKFIENDDFAERNPTLSAGVGNIKITTVRFPRQEFP